METNEKEFTVFLIKLFNQSKSMLNILNSNSFLNNSE